MQGNGDGSHAGFSTCDNVLAVAVGRPAILVGWLR